VLKGMALAFVAYKDPSLRPMNDLDLFLDERHLASGARILESLGYFCPDRFRGRHFPGELRIQKTGTQLLVELHTQIEVTAQATAAGVADIWSRSVKRRISDFEVSTLHEQDFLFHLCLHMARRHCYTTGLLAFVDVLKWIEAYEPVWDWPSLIRNARSMKYEAYVELTLNLVRDFFAAPIPPCFGSHLPNLEAMKDIVWQQVSDDRRVQNLVPPGLVVVLNASSFSSRLRTLLNRLRPTESSFPRSAAEVSSHIFMALGRLLHALRLGNLSRTRVQRQVHLQKQREQLATLLRNEGSRPA
jgi:hypothetical protein